MKIKPYIEKLESSEAYKNFKIKYPDAFLVAGFFVLDLETNMDVHQIDYYVPSEKKIAAFGVDGKVEVRLLETMNSKIPEKLDMDAIVDLDTLQGILTDEMRNRGMSENIRKIIAVIQNIDGKRIWNLNCVLTGMEILKSHVEDESRSVLKIEKTSIMDLMKTMPKPQQMIKAPETATDIKEELKKLDKVEHEIEKAKLKLKEELKMKQQKK